MFSIEAPSSPNNTKVRFSPTSHRSNVMKGAMLDMPQWKQQKLEVVEILDRDTVLSFIGNHSQMP